MTSIPHGATIVSIGYERRSVEDLIRLLTRNQVDVLVDVRLNAISRKKGFSKSSLSQALREAGIEYRHKRQLGNPKDNRDPFRRRLKSARAKYLRHLQNGASSTYQDVIDLAGTARIRPRWYSPYRSSMHRARPPRISSFLHSRHCPGGPPCTQGPRTVAPRGHGMPSTDHFPSYRGSGVGAVRTLRHARCRTADFVVNGSKPSEAATESGVSRSFTRYARPLAPCDLVVARYNGGGPRDSRRST